MNHEGRRTTCLCDLFHAQTESGPFFHMVTPRPLDNRRVTRAGPCGRETAGF
jgi:hypothetical protein